MIWYISYFFCFDINTVLTFDFLKGFSFTVVTFFDILLSLSVIHVFQTLNQVKGKLFSTIMTSLHEGIAATRIADFLNEQLRVLGKINGTAGAVLAVDTGEQCTISGVGPMYDEFLRTGRLTNYSGYGQKATTFHDKDFESAPL